ncbi:hypothetical protein CABS01_01409 [Colletotrichum abscissum]|uniref:Uncharacterized protein n=2 Tax=Colletotrichum acutatum species complex TaxID=2707335 RepID=A0A9P9X4U9_9PEZI|nr:uncharacterized protein CABS01_01409 [Colletotrichum abscissum]KAI3536540.1 hypothetical protein CABS02_12482 [Colletotrichum abscissum]KAK0376441.1 hypothetical protein CLIM01_06223 [Colletotrichum limetticola]KAK1495602.1 hypothetical protein CABS01_01409 [Colletotrichum abscissum]
MTREPRPKTAWGGLSWCVGEVWEGKRARRGGRMLAI